MKRASSIDLFCRNQSLLESNDVDKGGVPRRERTALALRNRLEAAFDRAARLSRADVDTETQADHTKYLCVLVSGLIETVIPELVIEYCGKQTSAPVLGYISGQLNKIQKLNVRKLTELLASFDKAWAKDFESFLEIDGKKESLNSVVALRNKIAHGESVPQMSLSRMTDYYKNIKTIIKFIEDKFTA